MILSGADIMANRNRSVPENVPGEFFVDSTCIDCDTCRQLAPAVFGEGDGHAYVHHQPAPADHRDALHALVCCPTGSIGSRGEMRPGSVLDDFPLLIDGPVFYSGFNSPLSYGGNSYFVRHTAGNWLIDSPKFLSRLVRRLEQMGGVSHIFLTHSDDVADAHRYAEHFSARRIIHRAELSAQPAAEVILDGDDNRPFGSDFLAIPTPGHTAGHTALLFQGRYLFTGDHLAWDRNMHRLEAHRDYCWHSWPQQVESLRRLLGVSFDWVLPGHGQRVHLSAHEMAQQLADLVARSEK
jgi:glyoxylase-like metal-dependent hydrolase (beta-lactamase superfamily II)/ferredoxin